MSEGNGLNIRSWAEEDRPREKLLLKGKSALTDAELIGILLGSGTRSLSAVDLAKQVLQEVGNDLNALAKMNVTDLKKFKGIGEAKAITIVSALELGRRRKFSDPEKRPRITSASQVHELMKPELLDLEQEQFWVLLLNRANMVIKKQQVSLGGITGTVVDPRIIFKLAIEHLASGIILIHNHPSGNVKPSDQDIKLTRQLKASAELLEITIFDHVIFANEGYFSLADENLL